MKPRDRDHAAGDVGAGHKAPLTTVLLCLALLEPERQPLLVAVHSPSRTQSAPGLWHWLSGTGSTGSISVPATISLPIS